MAPATARRTGGDDERSALGSALDWLNGRADVDPRAFGGLGFSNGGYILAQVAALDTRLSAVVLEATPSDIVEQTHWLFRRWGAFSQLPAVWALVRSGMPIHESTPRNVIAAIAPRPVLLLGGSEDPVVPAPMVRDLYEAARQPKELWLIPGAGHGHYDQIAPSEYRRRLVDFFVRALLR